MGVVFEGTMKGIPSVGFSLADSSDEADFSGVKTYIRDILRYVLNHGLPGGICLNVNFPKREGMDYSGLSVCRMSAGAWTSEWFSMQHPRGQQYFWLTGTFENHEPDAMDTDMWALKHNRVAVTPIRLDVTAYEFMDSLKSLEKL
jgi:5'-nucleotidase